MRMGHGGQCSDPAYAIKKFYSVYLPHCRAGHSPIDASDLTQNSAFPTAPAQWLSESARNVSIILGSKDFSDATSKDMVPSGSGPTSKTITRKQPYEFSRGQGGTKETSWDAMGRLATEVSWDRFMRGGALWFVSEKWLRQQPPRFAIAQGTRGVLTVSFDADSRRNASEMTVTALANRWSVLPGDVVTVAGQGQGDGLWLVSDTQQTLGDNTTTITLKRPTKPKIEPANETTTKTITIGGKPSGQHGGNAPVSANGLTLPTNITDRGGALKAAQFYAACKAISDRHLPYVYAGGHPTCGTPNGGGYCCSGSVCAALAAAGTYGFHTGGPSVASGGIQSDWGVYGEGHYFTLWASPVHVWAQFHGFPAWRFDTSPHDCGADGPQLRFCPRSTDTFTPKHWPGQ